MTFDELYNSLRRLAEENRTNGYPAYVGAAFMSGTSNVTGESFSPLIQCWTLQPDHIEVLVSELSRLQEENENLKDLLQIRRPLTAHKVLRSKR